MWIVHSFGCGRYRLGLNLSGEIGMDDEKSSGRCFPVLLDKKTIRRELRVKEKSHEDH